MRFKKVFIDYFLFVKFPNKFFQISITLAIGTIFGLKPTIYSIVSLILFYLSYVSVYIYNDLIDYEEDSKKRWVYYKPLLAGDISIRESIIFLAFWTPTLIYIITVWSPILGFLTLLSIILNNLRTHVRNITLRQFLLILVEIILFEIIWYSLYDFLIPLMLLPIFLAISSIYSVTPILYKKEFRSLKELSNYLKSKSKLLLLIMIFSIISSIPVLFLNFINFILLLGVTLSYLFVVMYITIRRYKGIDVFYKTTKKFYAVMLLYSFILLIMSIVIIKLNLVGFEAEFIKTIKETLKPYYTNLEYFNKLQEKLINRIFGYLKGYLDNFSK